MSDMGYLDGYIYHMVHFDNLRSIFQRRALLSKEKVLQEKIPYRSIAYEEVQTLRDRIFIWDFSRQKYGSLHSYVPFYFAIRTPMLHNKYAEGIKDKIPIFEVSCVIRKIQVVYFSDGNVFNKKLSIF